jgi:hypothetical protein
MLEILVGRLLTTNSTHYRSQSKASTPGPLLAVAALDCVIDNIGKKGAKDKAKSLKSTAKASSKAPGEQGPTALILILIEIAKSKAPNATAQPETIRECHGFMNP